MLTRARAAMIVAMFAASGCSSDEILSGAGGDARVLVLNTFGQTGITLVADTGSAGTLLDLPDSFDGGVLAVRGDTALTAASRDGGDVLYVASISQRSVTGIQLPAASNPAGAAFIPAGIVGSGAARYAVALRDSAAIAIVTPTVGGATITMARGAGRCPYDVTFSGVSAWSVDSNQDCLGSYASLGPVRLIRVSLNSAERDTLSLSNSARGAARAFAQGGLVYVFATGDFSSYPASVSTVDLASQRVIQTLVFPTGIYGTAVRLGEDGHLYVTASGFSPYAPRAYSIATATLSFRGARVAGQNMLDLRESSGSLARCDAATARADGSVVCVSNGLLLARLLVFNTAGAEIRSVAAGSLAADVALR